MGVSTQRLCAYLAVLAIVAGGVLGIIAIWTYVRFDIRAVKDDLSGRARQRILEEQRVHMAVLQGSQQPQTLAIREAADGEGRTPADVTHDDVSTQVRASGRSHDVRVPDMRSQGITSFDEPITRVRHSDDTASLFEITREICLVHADPVLGDGRKA